MKMAIPYDILSSKRGGPKMRSAWIRLAAAVVVMMSVVGQASPASCDDPIKKLGRGVANVVTCPFELTNQIHKSHDLDGPWAGLTVGPLKGFLMIAVRGVVGVYEIATFPIPLPENYRPILTEPEFFWEGDLY